MNRIVKPAQHSENQLPIQEVNQRPMNIAIDGPAGAGKSTIARLLAKRLGIGYLDTGAMYRAIGLKALQTGTDMQCEEKIKAMLAQTALDVVLGNDTQRVFLDGIDVTDQLRSKAVSKASSDVSVLPVVRDRLVALQREIAARQPLVLDGRDIGTYVLPNAPYKFYLTADIMERARRRLVDLRKKGDLKTCFDDVLQDVKYRDKQDSERDLAPLRQAADAILIDTTHLSIEEVIELVLQHIKRTA